MSARTLKVFALPALAVALTAAVLSAQLGGTGRAASVPPATPGARDADFSAVGQKGWEEAGALIRQTPIDPSATKK